MILITGATGLVGSHVLFDLVKAGKKVRVLKRSSSNLEIVSKIFSLYGASYEHMLAAIEWVDGDVTDYYSLLGALDGVRQVYHCAATVSFNPADIDHMMYVNVEGTNNVVNACLETGVDKLCFVSSVAALGRTGEDVLIDESSDWVDSADNSGYALSKHASEREVWRGIAEGLPAVIVNPSIIIGPGDPQKSSVQLLKQAHKGNLFFTSGVNSFVDVRDVSRAMITLMESPVSGKRFVLSGGNHTYRYLFNLMADAFGRRRPRINARPWMLELAWRADKIASVISRRPVLLTRDTARAANKRIRYSSKNITDEFGFSFIPIEVSIRDHCAHYLRFLAF